MLKKVYQYRCTDGTFVVKLEEAKLRERTYHIEQLTKYLMDDVQLSAPKGVARTLAERVLKDPSRLISILNSDKSAQNIVEELPP